MHQPHLHLIFHQQNSRSSILIFWVKFNGCAFVVESKKGKIMVRTLDKQTSDKVSFITFIVPEFVAAFKMSMPKVYKYLIRYGSFDFLSKH
jgi:hypothetical protein